MNTTLSPPFSSLGPLFTNLLGYSSRSPHEPFALKWGLPHTHVRMPTAAAQSSGSCPLNRTLATV